MHRTYTKADYLKLVRKIKRKNPGIAITTDVLVGFPGESEENFRNTVNLIKKIGPLKAHIFPYSRREGTSAAQDLSQEVPAQIIKERISILKKVADTCSRNYKQRFLCKKMQVLFEEEVKGSPGWWQGHTDNYIKVIIESRVNLKNKFLKKRFDKYISL
jgi:threonylcarbamoyladenosine tRNA methylthiotransferase MtaB